MPFFVIGPNQRFYTMRFYVFGSKNAQNKMYRSLSICKVPKIVIFKLANIVIFDFWLLWESKNAPKSIFCPNQSFGVITHFNMNLRKA